MSELVSVSLATLGLTIQLTVMLLYRERLFNGIISRLMGRIFLPSNMRYPFVYGVIRIVCVIAVLVVTRNHNGIVSDLVFWGPIIILYGDDILTGDDNDKWKKRWESIKNKIKWKMELPRLVPDAVKA